MPKLVLTAKKDAVACGEFGVSCPTCIVAHHAYASFATQEEVRHYLRVEGRALQVAKTVLAFFYRSSIRLLDFML